MNPANSFAWWPVLFLAVTAAVWDLLTRRIPNRLVLTFLMAGLAAQTIHSGWGGLRAAVWGMALSAFVFGIFWRLHAMGAGDLKLGVAVGAWIGPGQLTTALVMTGLAGGIMAVFWAASTGTLGQSLRGAGEVISRAASRGLRPHPRLVLENKAARTMPYAPAIAAGAILSFFYSFA